MPRFALCAITCLAAIVVAGCSNETTNDGPPPNAPTGLAVSLNADGSVKFSWNGNSADELGWNIYRGTTGTSGPYSLLAQLPTADLTKYFDANLTASTTYYYTVTAYSANGESSVPTGVMITTGVTVPKTSEPPTAVSWAR